MNQNLLSQETSPYLLLHRDNPVHWRPWTPEAFAEAEESGKPVLLSVGYTACHWCHVMNHESFADADTAALMNERFINIKVDREERPDIDVLYQAAANSMGVAGGWPLTMFLTPQGEPFFAGTYYPREDRPGQPAFKRILEEVSRIYREQPEPVANTTRKVQDTLTKLSGRNLSGPLDTTVLDRAAIHIGQKFDIFYGGITGSPKFPSVPSVELLFRAYLRTGVPQFLQLVQGTIENMSQGGIYDHVGGGYARYSTDERWIAPHFEKMLYDNAQLVELLTLVWQGTRSPLCKARVEETIAWVLREMQAGEAFAAAIDADSEGEEGKFYLWTEAEIDAALIGTFAQRFKEVYNVRREGNFSQSHPEKNILYRFGRPYPLAEADEALLKRQRELLLAARDKRIRPVRDDKILADWNGMMIAALARAGAVFRNAQWTASAIRAFDFIVKAMGDGERLYHSWRDGKRGAQGFSEDYAQMARAALALWQATADERYLNHAHGWVRTLNEHFWDVQNGGYFQTSDEADPLIVRTRFAFDQATPSANGLMIQVLCKLYLATNEPSYRERSNAIIQAFATELERVTQAMGSYLGGLENVMSGIQIVIIGPIGNPKTHELIAAVEGRALPTAVLMVKQPGQALPEGHPAFGKTMENGQPTAYICQRQTCSAPITNPVTLSQALQLPARPAGTA